MIWPLTLSSTGPVKTSPSGKFSWPSQLIHLRSGDAQAYIGAVGGDHAVVALAVEEIRQPLLPLAGTRQAATGSGSIKHAGVKDEILVLRKAHLRVLGRGLRGKLRAGPAQFAAAAARWRNVSMIGLRAAWLRPRRRGSQWVSDLVFSSAQMPIEQSIVSTSNLLIGLRNWSCASRAVLQHDL